MSLRHLKSVDFCREVGQYADQHKRRVYAPLLHPDIADQPSAHGHERFKMIRNALIGSRGTLLDIAAHWGYFCHRFEALGFACTAAENSPRHLYFMKRLRAAAKAKFKIFDGSIFDIQDPRFDVTLALKTFHHFLKRADTFDSLKQFLERLETKCMVFQSHLYRSPQMKGAYCNFKPEEFLAWIRVRCGLRNSRRLGGAKDGRPILFA